MRLLLACIALTACATPPCVNRSTFRGQTYVEVRASDACLKAYDKGLIP